MNYKKYNNFNEIKKHDEIKITSTNEWNGCYGVVQDIDYIHKLAVIISIAKPVYVYYINEYNVHEIEKLEY